MAESPVFIVSPDADFAQGLAEQVKAELGLSCQVAQGFDAQAAPRLVVTTEDLPEGCGLTCPVVSVKRKPLRMTPLLAEIRQGLSQQAEDVALPSGYVLHFRAKQLAREGRAVDLTDKEASLLLCLKEAGKDGLSKEQILKKVWGFDSSLDTHTLETHIYRLRSKLRELAPEGEDGLIMAHQGGYAIATP